MTWFDMAIDDHKTQIGPCLLTMGMERVIPQTTYSRILSSADVHLPFCGHLVRAFVSTLLVRSQHPEV